MQANGGLRPEVAYLDAAPTAVLMTDAKLDRPGPTVIYVNPAFERMTGWPAAEIVGRTPRVLQGGDTDMSLFRGMKAALKRVGRWQGETVNYRHDGSPFVMRWSIAPVTDSAGQVVNYMAVQEDVTQDRLRAASYQRMQTLVARLVDAAPDGLIVTGPDARIVQANQGAAQILDCDSDHLAGRPFDWIVPGGLDAIRAADPASENGDEGEGRDTPRSESEITAYRQDGTAFPAAVSLVCVDDAEQGCHAVFLRDLTARKASENALVVSQTRLRNAQRIGRMGGWFYDTTSRETEVMPEVLYLLGEQADTCSFDPSRVNDAIHPDDRARVAQTFRAAVDAGQRYRCEYRLLLANETTIVVDAVGEPITDDDGCVTGYAGVVQDITERHRVQEELVAARNAAVASSETKSRFLAMMGHELRTPLNAINGFAELLAHETLGPHAIPDYKQYAEYIHGSGEHLLGIIESVLDVARVENGRMALEEDIVSAGDLLKTATGWMADRADREKLRLELAEGAPVNIQADPRLIRQIVTNLIDNAIKFSPEGALIEVTHAIGSDGTLRLSVRDEGPGIPSDYVSEITEPFVQVDTRLERKYEGLGLGLHLVQSFLKLHGGRLHLDTAPGAGTTATAILPPERVLGAPEIGFAPVAEPQDSPEAGKVASG